MIDNLTFQIINPKGKEEWADDYNIEKVVEIYINEIEIIDILKPIETPFAIRDNQPNLAGNYGHQTPEELYSNLTEYSENVELLCCGGCGIIGCWSISVNIEKDDKYVYWKEFKHNHRDWKYNISYKFDKEKYESAMKKLHNSI